VFLFEPDENENTDRQGDGGIGCVIHGCFPKPVSPRCIKGVRGNREGWVKFEGSNLLPFFNWNAPPVRVMIVPFCTIRFLLSTSVGTLCSSLRTPRVC
jgi:hypothetical protein